MISGLFPSKYAVLFSLGLLAGGTWLFIGWRLRRVEAAWPSVGMDG